MGQLTTGGGGVYLPDYSVRQLTDLQIIKVTKINACTLNMKTSNNNNNKTHSNIIYMSHKCPADRM